MSVKVTKDRTWLKNAWKENMTRIMKSDSFLEIWNQLKLNKYKIMPMKKEHIHEIVNIASYQFSSQGGTMARLVIQESTINAHNRNH